MDFKRKEFPSLIFSSRGVEWSRKFACIILSKRIATPMATFKNEFSWSKTRDEIFKSCPRKYWFAYYGFWNGWLKDAPERARRIYVLKNLKTRSTNPDRLHSWLSLPSFLQCHQISELPFMLGIVFSKIISGGQTGVDRMPLDIILPLELRIPCGGWCTMRRRWGLRELWGK